MIRLHLRDTFAGDATTIRHDVEWHGQTYAELLLEYKLEGWDGVALDVAIDGRLLEQDDLDRVGLNRGIPRRRRRRRECPIDSPLHVSIGDHRARPVQTMVCKDLAKPGDFVTRFEVLR